EAAVTKTIGGARYVIAFARAALADVADEGGIDAWLAGRCAAVMAETSIPVRREIEGISKMVDVRAFLRRAELGGPASRAEIERAGLVGDLALVAVEVAIPGSGGVKAAEVARVIAGVDVPHRAVRTQLV